MLTLKYALRTLLKSPFVTTVAVLSLALGIGANAAIFSLFNQMLLRPLPVTAPQQLVNLSAPGPKPGSTSCNQAGTCEEVFSYAMFRDLERSQTVLRGLAAHRSFGANIAYKNQTLSGEGMLVSGSYFPTLGVQAARGRLIGPADDRNIAGHPVAVLSHRFWETQLGSDPAVIDQVIVVNGQSLTIIGVAPDGFRGTTLGSDPRVFVPLTMRGALGSNVGDFDRRNAYWAYVFGRLKDGGSLAQASEGINAVYGPIITDVEAPQQENISAATLQRFKARKVTLTPGARGQSDLHTEARLPLILLFSITGIVLLIACANIANLLLARAANRSMEMAVRLSIGAARWQLMRQLLAESVLLSLIGGAASLVVARWTLGAIAGMLPDEAAGVFTLSLDANVVLFAAITAVLTGILFGLFPALHSTRADLIGTIRSNAGNLSSHRAATRFRTSLVTAQIALSMSLLIAAGLFIRSLDNISKVDLGVKIDHVATFIISPRRSGYEPARSKALFQRVEEELAALPGVTAVSSGLVRILAGNNWGNSVRVEGFQADPDTDTGASFNEIGTAYLSSLGIPLLAGREFTASDALGAPRVAIVNEAFARKFKLGKDAVGKRISDDGPTGELNIEIVGLMKDAKYSQVKDAIPPQYFLPWRQDSTIGALNFYVRSSSEPEQLLQSIPRLIAKLDANLPVEDLRTLPQQVNQNVFMDRMISTLSAAFAILATLLAAVGLYGVLAYTVAQRTREIGVRMALGASGGMVRGMVLRQVAMMVVVGGLIGIAAALAMGRGAQSLLYGVKGFDLVATIGGAIVLGLVALAAGYVPALKASQVDPMRALRFD
ncbi:MAG TPA: ABC transporter permease [Gemmatimonadaceae bacterium]|nr:ABC transporter permease [Gemmatimonadaceae bacterium]HPV74070.1 ABC transporter permease [Gemmatimonadaceae bacterium]